MCTLEYPRHDITGFAGRSLIQSYKLMNPIRNVHCMYTTDILKVNIWKPKKKNHNDYSFLNFICMSKFYFLIKYILPLELCDGS